MSNNLEKLFKANNQSASLDSLKTKIFLKIEEEQEKIENRHLIFSRILGVLSLTAFFPFFINLARQLSVSGFWSYLSLLFTDTGMVAIYWKQFSLSLAEILPVFDLSLFLLSLLALFVSLKFGVVNKDFKKIILSANFV